MFSDWCCINVYLPAFKYFLSLLFQILTSCYVKLLWVMLFRVYSTFEFEGLWEFYKANLGSFHCLLLYFCKGMNFTPSVTIPWALTLCSLFTVFLSFSVAQRRVFCLLSSNLKTFLPLGPSILHCFLILVIALFFTSKFPVFPRWFGLLIFWELPVFFFFFDFISFVYKWLLKHLMVVNLKYLSANHFHWFSFYSDWDVFNWSLIEVWTFRISCHETLGFN